MRGIARKIGDIADEFLERLLMMEDEKGDHAGMAKESGLWVKDDLWSVDYHLVHKVTDDLDPGGRFYLMAEPADNLAAVWPIDHAIAIRKDDHWQLGRMVTAAPRELRGVTKIVPQKSAHYLAGWAYDDGSFYSESHVIGMVGGKWRSLEEPERWRMTGSVRGDKARIGRHYTPQLQAEIEQTAHMLTATALTERYDWHAALGFCDNGPRMLIPTNPSGCLALFKARESAPGESRRSALKHWVNSYYRSGQDDPGRMDYVREHLRGHTRFIWNALDCELMVSAYDLEKNEEFRLQAAEWRAQRKHNRVRLRRKA